MSYQLGTYEQFSTGIKRIAAEEFGKALVHPGPSKPIV